MGWVKGILLLGVVAAIASGYFFWLKPLQQKATGRDEAVASALLSQQALTTAQADFDDKAAALEKDRQDTQTLNEKLTAKLHRIDTSNEKIDCPVPAVLRDAINGM